MLQRNWWDSLWVLRDPQESSAENSSGPSVSAFLSAHSASDRMMLWVPKLEEACEELRKKVEKIVLISKASLSSSYMRAEETSL